MQHKRGKANEGLRKMIKGVPVLGSLLWRLYMIIKAPTKIKYLFAELDDLRNRNNALASKVSRLVNKPLEGHGWSEFYRTMTAPHDDISLLSNKLQEELKTIEKIHKEPKLTGLVSQLVTQSQMESEIYKKWCYEMKEIPRFHRKQWEYVYVLQGLYENNLLRPGTVGLGFGVGKEPLPAVMAKYGCKVIATDMDVALAQKKGWTDSNQHSSSKNGLNNRSICDKDKFDRLVSYRVADMNNIDAALKAMRYDFVWSCCALDHLGSIELGIKFIKESSKLLKPAGIAIHTTEYNVLSNSDTLDHQGTVLFRRRDIESLLKELRSDGYCVSFNPHIGNRSIDKHIDTLPYKNNNHLKLLIGQYVSTSVGLLIKKSPSD